MGPGPTRGWAAHICSLTAAVPWGDWAQAMARPEAGSEKLSGACYMAVGEMHEKIPSSDRVPGFGCILSEELVDFVLAAKKCCPGPWGKGA